MSRRRRRGLGLVLLALVAGLVAGPTVWARLSSAPHRYDVASVPDQPVALVLGASVRGGVPSPFLAARLEVARQLFAAGKVKAILVSGDNREASYDEPTAMRTWLLEHGVPERKVVADYAGLDTYDSCWRATRIFGAHRVVVVTQAYHLPRAVATCRALGLDAVGVGDESMRAYSATWAKGESREVLASYKMAWDLLSRRAATGGPRETSLDAAVREP